MQKVACPSCSTEFNADTSRAHQELGQLKCAWCSHIFPDPGPDETSKLAPEFASQTASHGEPIPTRDLFRVDVQFEIRPDVPVDDEEGFLKRVHSALVNSTACTALSEAIGGSVTLSDVEPKIFGSRLTSIASDETAMCPECNRPVGTVHAPGCGKRIIGADTVMPEDCEGEA